jgi:hypothetical protein
MNPRNVISMHVYSKSIQRNACLNSQGKHPLFSDDSTTNNTRLQFEYQYYHRTRIRCQQTSPSTDENYQKYNIMKRTFGYSAENTICFG